MATHLFSVNSEPRLSESGVSSPSLPDSSAGLLRVDVSTSRSLSNSPDQPSHSSNSIPWAAAPNQGHGIVSQNVPPSARSLSASNSNEIAPPSLSLPNTAAVGTVVIQLDPVPLSNQLDSSGAKKGRTERAASAVLRVSSAVLTLDELLDNSRPSPLTQDEFRKFLKTSFADENLDFLLAVRAYNQMPPGSAEQAEAAADIVGQFIEDHSKQSVNISSAMRRDILSSYKSRDKLEGLFNNANREIRKLIESGHFVMNFFAASARNLNCYEVARRWRMFGAALLITIAVTLGLWFGVSTRWYRVVVIFPLYFTCYLGISATSAVCSRLSAQHKRLPESACVFRMIGMYDDCSVELKDKTLLDKIHAIAQRNRVLIPIFASLFTAGIVALPSMILI